MGKFLILVIAVALYGTITTESKTMMQNRANELKCFQKKQKIGNLFVHYSQKRNETIHKCYKLIQLSIENIDKVKEQRLRDIIAERDAQILNLTEQARVITAELALRESAKNKLDNNLKNFQSQLEKKNNEIKKFANKIKDLETRHNKLQGNFSELEGNLKICKNNEIINSEFENKKMNTLETSYKKLQENFTEQEEHLKVCRNSETKFKTLEITFKKLQENFTEQEENLKICKNNETKLKTVETNLKKLQENFAEQEENLKICKQNVSETVNNLKQEEDLKICKNNETKLKTVETNLKKLQENFTEQEENLKICKNNETKLKTVEKNLKKLQEKFAEQEENLKICKQNVSEAVNKPKQEEDLKICKHNETKLKTVETNLKKLQEKFAEQEENLKICKQNVSEAVKKPEQKEEKDESKCPSFGGAHLISLPNREAFKVPCAVVGSDKQVWSIVERRLNQKINFNRGWAEYAQGFGDFSSEFFIGLEKLHQMTSSKPHKLLIRLNNGQSVKTASYSNFRIGNETEGYAIQSLGEYSGDAGDGLRESLNQKFSTFDRDNDLLHDVNCSKDASGGWWQTNCGKSNLNFYLRSNMVYWDGVIDSIYSVEILIRPTNIDGN